MFDAYLNALEAHDAEAVAAALAPEVVLHVAVHDEPIVGRDAARVVFRFLFDGVFSGLVVREVIGDGRTRAFVFDVDVTGVPLRAEGVNVVRLDDAGRPVEVTVFLRPLRALSAVMRQMGKRFGAPVPQ